ncbi:hypothetical protein PoB_005169600 [Plakobranchus ocellatus]|uniref:Uncharacterized protein n=1 Tax=Plakobranchus ocellatus TaxID=259542 RepID=A0AAV4BXD1_9GAST|nr:hypothetical protein PoB_005169600 [Plakobranchus ocellatus]
MPPKSSPKSLARVKDPPIPLFATHFMNHRLDKKAYKYLSCVYKGVAALMGLRRHGTEAYTIGQCVLQKLKLKVMQCCRLMSQALNIMGD